MVNDTKAQKQYHSMGEGPKSKQKIVET